MDQRHEKEDKDKDDEGPEGAEGEKASEMSEGVPDEVSGEGDTPLGGTDQHSDAPGPHGTD